MKKKKVKKTYPRFEVQSAAPLTETELMLIKEKFPVMEAEIVQTVDPTLMSGVVVRYGTEVIDMSLSRALVNLKQYLI